MAQHETDSSETSRLIERLRLGDAPALDALLERHRDYLRRHFDVRMARALRARLDPSDLVQETQLEAVRRADDYCQQPSLPFRLWLRQIAQDRLVMARRRHIGAARRTVDREISLPEGSSVALAGRLLASDSSPLAQAGRRETARHVRAAIAELSQIDREIILLHNFEGLTSPEAARVLGIEPAAARKRYGRALLRLRRLLIEAGLGGSER